MAKKTVRRTGTFYWKPHRHGVFTFWLWWCWVKT